ncbi:O-antigen polysaccharide polymerase Wzy family protein [Actinomyces sp. MRS3W]|uniref:O-antigen polysaccharide polymerase Wzy family protein n=1 Tax=Actinomyces sp. MRS3W TaxID=2800796 RepID=UPI0028FCFEC6|nr:O-antigen polysaccharide polymerase Wzy family protein [Actinomyces sp. MRS3W]MDU0348858.1 O-antigen polysaccharide polymerase Wzy family protein [Actinomyces sp. MRS3W]
MSASTSSGSSASQSARRQAILPLVGLLCNLGVIALALGTQASLVWTLILLLWLNALLFGVARLSERAIFVAFLVAFFFLLLGREITVDFFHYEVIQAPPAQTRHLQLCLTLSLLGLLAGALVASSWRARRRLLAEPTEARLSPRLFADPSIVRCIYWVVLVLSLISVALRARYVLANGYLSYYTEFSDLEDSSGSMYGLRRIEIMLPMVLAIYLGVFPPRRQVTAASAGWAVYLVLSLLTGQRSTFVGGAVMLLAYWIVRRHQDPPGTWRMRRGGKLVAAIAVPVVAIALAAVESARGIGAVAADTANRNPILQMLYGQGVSSSVVRNAYTYADFIPRDWYTGEFLHSGVLARLLGYPVYHGNTLEHALHGGSFTHAYGYTLLGPQYFSGRGSGSSFIAELFYDYGYAGVFLGGMIYGAICIWGCALKPGQPLRNGLRLVIVTTLLWAPRGSATGFLTTWLSPSVLVALVGVAGLSLAAALLRERGILDPPAASVRGTHRARRTPPASLPMHARGTNAQ